MTSFMFLIIMISSLLSVAFFTILERKILGYIQIRKGPNKVGYLGILQPFSDAIKLFSKSIFVMESMNKFLSLVSPFMTIFLSMLMFTILPFSFYGLFDSTMSILSFFIISSMMVYAILMIGWSSNSKYSFIGAIRSIAQIISYEVSMFIIIISTSILSKSYSFFHFLYYQKFSPFLLFLSMSFLMWIIICLAETNRSPFDFAEGESELVSGFNVEYMGGWFAFIFLAEYMSMMSISMISTIIFIGTLMFLYSWLMIVMLSFMLLWIRGTLPRFRYDLLMHMNWLVLLPISITTFSILPPFIFFSS